ncbi:MAG TPA: hypothetical protein VJN70_07430 [Gemmatimonadaceae bacterium]|nr:hypothetical protein [Gemmatimonadaceae bacterium]
MSAASVVSPSVPRSVLILSRLQVWLPWLVGALTLVAAVHAIEPLPVGVFYDDAQYVVLAKSLATGEGYRFINLPGAPFGTHFPPGYPAFLALLWQISPAFPENVALMKFANAILLAVVALVAFRFARRTLELPSGVAAVTALAGTATIPSLLLSSSIMSEPLFLAMLLPLLAWAERETSTSRASGLVMPLLLGAAAGVLTLVRTHGVALVAAIVVVYVVRRRRREASLSLLAAMSVIAPWLVWVAAHNDGLPPLIRGAYGSYFAWFVSGFRDEGLQLLLVTLPNNVATTWTAIVRSIVPDVHWSLDLLIGGVFIALASIGMTTCWRRARVMTLFVIFYFAIILVWPFSPLRFVWGIWPLVMLFPAAGFAAAWHMSPVRQYVPRASLVIAVAVLCVATAAFNARGYQNAWWSSNARYHARRVLPQLAWVARATHPRDVVGSDAEASVYLYTGRHAVPVTSFTAGEYARERTPDEQTAIVLQLLDHYQPRYVLATSPQVIDAAARVARSRPTAFVLIDSLMPGVVYEDRHARDLQR